MISQSEIDALRSRVDIAAIIGRTVELRRDGREYVGCCPFHQEKTPSFKVDPKKNGGVYICFGCGAKGDVFRFIQMHEGLQFPAAVERVKDLAGIAPAPPAPASQPGRRTLVSMPQVRPAQAARPKIGPITATYTYLDEKGNALFEVCRHEPGEDGKAKSFRQRVPSPGGYSYSVKGVRRVLYRLPQIIAAAEVWICEGEKDVHTLEAQGLVATTNAGGAKAPWLPEYSESLAGKDVFIIPDNDEPGQARGELIARELAGKAGRVITVRLPDSCKDVTDFIEAGNSAHDLRQMADEARAALKPAPEPSFLPLEAGETLNPNDIARLIMRDHVILADQRGYVFEYNHRFWESITIQRIAAYAMAYDTHRETKARRRGEAASYVVTASHIREIKWRQVALSEIPVWNGVVNLETGNLRPHRKEDYLETVPPVPFMGQKPCPTWLEALRTYWGDDPDYTAKVAALQEFFGYTLMTHARYKKALMLVGESNCGKSQIPQVIRMLVGDGNISAVPVEHMDDPRKLSPIVGKMVNLLTELTSKAMVADGGFKTLVSTEEPLLIDPKNLQPMLYAPIAKHIIACNSLPRVTDLSRGFFDRLLLLKFNRVIPEAERDRSIVDKFRRELEGILAWSLEGARRLFENGGDFTRVPESEAAINEYREESNPVNAFIVECCAQVDEADVNPILVSEFAEKFSQWAGTGKHYDVRAVSSMLRSAGRKVEKCIQRGPFYQKRCVYGLEFNSH